MERLTRRLYFGHLKKHSRNFHKNSRFHQLWVGDSCGKMSKKACISSIPLLHRWRLLVQLQLQSDNQRLQQPSAPPLFSERSRWQCRRWHAAKGWIPSLNSLGRVKKQRQVWPLTHFFLFLFCKKNHWFAQINDPSSGKHCSLPFLQATPSCLSRTLEGLFELTRHPPRALDSPCVLLELRVVYSSKSSDQDQFIAMIWEKSSDQSSCLNLNLSFYLELT